MKNFQVIQRRVGVQGALPNVIRRLPLCLGVSVVVLSNIFINHGEHREHRDCSLKAPTLDFVPQRSRRDSQLRDECIGVLTATPRTHGAGRLLQKVFEKFQRLRIFALAQVPDGFLAHFN